MKHAISTITSSIALIAMMSGPASAMVAKEGSIRDLLSVTSDSSIILIKVDDGIATITGNFESAIDKNLTVQAAKRKDGVEQVIDLTTISN